IVYSPPNNFNFEDQSILAYLAYTIIRFNCVDSNIVSGVKTPQYYDFNIGNHTFSGNGANYLIKNTALYSALASGMGTAPESTVRLIDRCDIFAYITTRDYFYYQQSALTQGVGITGNE